MRVKPSSSLVSMIWQPGESKGLVGGIQEHRQGVEGVRKKYPNKHRLSLFSLPTDTNHIILN